MQQSLLAAERTAETRRRRVRSNGMVGYRYDAAVNGTNGWRRPPRCFIFLRVETIGDQRC